MTIRFGDPTFKILVLNGRFGGTEATEDCYYSSYACQFAVKTLKVFNYYARALGMLVPGNFHSMIPS